MASGRIDLLSTTAALIGVLLLGILQGIVLSAPASIVLLLAQYSTVHVAFLGRIPGTTQFSDVARHPDNKRLVGLLVCRPEASLFYLNADFVLTRELERLQSETNIKRVVCDLSSSPMMDLAGARILAELSRTLRAQGVSLMVVNAVGRVRDLLRAERLDAHIQGIARGAVIEDVLA